MRTGKEFDIAEDEEFLIPYTNIGQETLFEKVWNHLMKDEVGIVGLYGAGGVGKTILLKQINNKFYEIVGKVDFVIWIVVSHDTTIHKVQRDIARKLGILEKEWDQKEENERAFDIKKVLTKWKFVLLLDDIWEKVNLEAIGVPYPSIENGCKVIFTTRSKEVCDCMGVDDPIKVTCLHCAKVWDLIQNTLESNQNILDNSRKVDKPRSHLPIALNVTKKSMACENTIAERCEMLEIKIEKTTWNKSLIKGKCFSNISYVSIQYCVGLKDLTWLLFASNLIHLEVRHSKDLDSIISKEQAVSLLGEEEEEYIRIIPFKKLEVLKLNSLPAMKSIYWSSLPFPCLKKIDVFDCDMLSKLPLDSKSVGNVKEFVIVYEDPEWAEGYDWGERIKWKDEATKLRFLPSLNTY